MKKLQIDTFASWTDIRFGYCFTRIDKCCWNLELQFGPFFLTFDNSTWQCPNDQYWQMVDDMNDDATGTEFIKNMNSLIEGLFEEEDAEAVRRALEEQDDVPEDWETVRARLGLGDK